MNGIDKEKKGGEMEIIENEKIIISGKRKGERIPAKKIVIKEGDLK